MVYLLLSLFLSLSVFAQEAQEPRLRFLDVFTKIPETGKDTLQTSFSKEAIPGWLAVLGSTAVLYEYDEKLYSYSQKKGRDWHIGNRDNTKPILQAYGHELVRLPTDTGSALYFLGDGWLHFSIAASVYGYGHFTDSSYDANTGIMLMHGMVVSTLFNQTLKRSFGRESPEVKTQERGAWRPFPSFNAYNNRTANYDAMPSGHVMTATMTFTILAERYPAYKVPIYSVGGVWASALMFEMMNNGVHWASDYPLGIAMGWVIGRASTRMISRAGKDKIESTDWNFLPMINGTSGIIASRNF